MKDEQLVPYVTVPSSEFRAQGYTHQIRLVGSYDAKAVRQWLRTSNADCYISKTIGASIIAFNNAEDAVSFRLSFSTAVENDIEFLGVKYEEIKKTKQTN